MARNSTGRLGLGLVFALMMLLPACTVSTTATPASNATAASPTASGAPVIAPTTGTTGSPVATATPAGTATSTTGPVPSPVASPASTSTGVAATPPGYLDDRSSATEVILSYYNAINMQQYARAYSYWEPRPQAAQLPPFDQFQQGYANTLHVDVTFGQVGSGAVAGNFYFSVPVALVSKTSGNGTQTFVGCYGLHLANPANQVVPPYNPIAIQSADIKQVSNNANVHLLLGNACPAQPESGPLGLATGRPNSIGSDVYLDDRTDGADVVRSYYNAINDQQYVRAYSYWENSAGTTVPMAPPFPQFKQGYANTRSVRLTIGNVTTGAGAGQRYASVPVTIVAAQNDGGTQTYVGCYVTHLASPNIQSVPPFHPMSISRATVNQVANDADTNAMMATICQP